MEQRQKSGKLKDAWNRLLERMITVDAQTFYRVTGKLLFFVLLFIQFLVLAAQIPKSVKTGEYLSVFIVFGVECLLTLVEALKLFVLKEFNAKIPCYVIDVLCSFVLGSFTNNAFLCSLYVVVLTELYLSKPKIMPSLLVYVVALVVYFVSFWGVGAFRPTPSAFVETLAGSFGDMVVLFLHFVAVTAGVQFYLQYAKLRKTLKELDESKAQLQDAYDHLAEVTALEERQRIAKDIHDTAGHSITTVIMQTEAAKMVLETDPADAKVRIVAANLQAKHALEELRESVHLLSGSNGKGSLKAELEEIIHQTTDGTDIKIRSEIQDVIVSSKKYRFLCNTLKEGIANGLRHGGATAFWFELKQDENGIVFLLSDNGVGADVNALQLGFGLSGMQQQVESMGGRMQILGDEGFEIQIQLPFDGTTI